MLHLLQGHPFGFRHHEFHPDELQDHHEAEEGKDISGRKGGDHARKKRGEQRGEEPVREAAERLPSEPPLVKQFGVSRPTVGRALLDLQNEGLIEQRAGSGAYVKGGAPAHAAASTRQLGLLIPGLDTTEIFQLICGELASLAQVHEYGFTYKGTGHLKIKCGRGFWI